MGENSLQKGKRKMIDQEFDTDYILHWQNAGSSWRNFERIKYLRAFWEAIKIELMELERDPAGNREEMVQKKLYRKPYRKKSKDLKETPCIQNWKSN